MKILPILIGALALATHSLAADDPIAVRQALMDNNGAAAALAGGMLKDEIPYNPVVGKAVIDALSATALAYGSFFPEGSVDPARSQASPKIWEDAAGFQAELAKFQDRHRRRASRPRARTGRPTRRPSPRRSSRSSAPASPATRPTAPRTEAAPDAAAPRLARRRSLAGRRRAASSS